MKRQVYCFCERLFLFLSCLLIITSGTFAVSTSNSGSLFAVEKVAFKDALEGTSRMNLDSVLVSAPSIPLLDSLGQKAPKEQLQLSSERSSLAFSTFLGGSSGDFGSGIAVAADDSCYVTGETYSSDFPTKYAYNSTFGGNYDAFVAKFSASDSLLWSTYLGGSDWDLGQGIAVAADGSCYVTGWTESSNFPTMNAYQSTLCGDKDAFVVKIIEVKNTPNTITTVVISASSFLSCLIVFTLVAFIIRKRK